MSEERYAAPAKAALEGAERLHDEHAVQRAYDRLAHEIAARLGSAEPVVLAVMLGGLVPTAALMGRFRFLYRLDYVHATRYRGETRGGELHWIARPRVDLAGRAVLIVDDIFDEGVTLARIAEYCRDAGAASVHCAVLVRKRHDRSPAGFRPDFVGLEVEDRYVFGCGMDFREHFRGLPAIYALRREDDP